jgi:hypothetical protein
MDLATIMRGAGLTPKPRTQRHAAAAAPQQQQQPAGAAAVTAPSGETVQVRLPVGSNGSSDGSSSGRRAKGSTPRIIGVVSDEKALPGSTGRDGTPSPRPATVLPRSNKVKPAAAAAAGSSGSSGDAPKYTPIAAAGAAAAMAAATVATGGGAAATTADAGSSNGSSRGSSRGSSPTGPQQQQGSAADKDLAWDEWSQYLAPWRVSAAAAVVTGLTCSMDPGPDLPKP